MRVSRNFAVKMSSSCSPSGMFFFTVSRPRVADALVSIAYEDFPVSELPSDMLFSYQVTSVSWAFFSPAVMTPSGSEMYTSGWMTSGTSVWSGTYSPVVALYCCMVLPLTMRSDTLLSSGL